MPYKRVLIEDPLRGSGTKEVYELSGDGATDVEVLLELDRRRRERLEHMRAHLLEEIVAAGREICAERPGTRAAEDAHRMAIEGREARLALARGDAATAIVYAYAAGRLAERLDLRRLERVATTGRKVRSAGPATKRARERAGKLARHHVGLFARIATDVRRDHPKWGVTAIRDGVVELVHKRHPEIPCSRRTLERLKIPAN